MRLVMKSITEHAVTTAVGAPACPWVVSNSGVAAATKPVQVASVAFVAASSITNDRYVLSVCALTAALLTTPVAYRRTAEPAAISPLYATVMHLSAIGSPGLRFVALNTAEPV